MLRVKDVTLKEHQLLVLWAAECAEKVLPLFEKKYVNDERPRKAIEAARAWACGKIKMQDARKAALAAHAAARKAKIDSAIFAARAAGHAAATAHTPGHAPGPVYYAMKAIDAKEREQKANKAKLVRKKKGRVFKKG